MATIKYINIGGIKHEIKATYDANGLKIDEAYVKNEILDNYSKKSDVADEVTAQLKTIVGEAPEALDTLKELSAALGDDPNFAASMTEQFTRVNEAIEAETSAREASDLELQNKFSSYVEKSVLDDYYVKGYIDETYAKKSEIPTDYATKDEIPTNFYTREEIDSKLESIEGGEIDLTGYATKEDIKNQVTYTETSYLGNPKKVITLDNADLIMGKVNPDEIPEEFTEAYGDVSALTLLQLNAWNLVDVGSPYTTVNLNSTLLLTPTILFAGAGTHPIAYLPEGTVSGLIDLEPIRTSIEELLNKSVDLTGYATEKWVKDLNYLTEHLDISNLATKDEIANLVTWYQTAYNGDEKKVVMFDNMELLMSKTNPNEIPEGMEDPGSVTLLQLNKWNIVDIGSPKTIVNLNTLPGYRPTVQEAGQSGEEAYQIAYTSDIEGLLSTIDTHTTEIADLQSDVAENLVNAKSYADKAIADLIGTAPETLNTLQEIAAELADLDSVVTTITTKLGELESKLPNTEGLATEKWVEGKGYLTEIPSEYVTETELNNKNYLTSVPDTYATKDYVDGKETFDSELRTLFLTYKESTAETISIINSSLDKKLESSDLSGYAKLSDVELKADATSIPTLLSLLTNDSKYITSDEAAGAYQAKGDYLTEIPAEYVTETELTEKGYLTEIPDTYATVDYVNGKYDAALRTEFEAYKTSNDTAISEINSSLAFKLEESALSDYAKASEIPTTTSLLDNDSGYITSEFAGNTYQPKGNYLTSIPEDYMLTGANLYLTDYSTLTYSAISGNDSANIAIAKLENLILSLASTISLLLAKVNTLEKQVSLLIGGGGDETPTTPRIYYGLANPDGIDNYNEDLREDTGDTMELTADMIDAANFQYVEVTEPGSINITSPGQYGDRLYILVPSGITFSLVKDNFTYTTNYNTYPVEYNGVTYTAYIYFGDDNTSSIYTMNYAN